MNDLDWLCRNVHEWPTLGTNDPANVHRRWKGDDVVAISKLPCDVVNDDDYYTYDQWLTRRAGLQNKPSLDDFDLDWLAQDEDGEWWEFENEPKQFNENQWHSKGRKCHICTGEVLGDWRNTLERRLERKPSDKTAKALEEASKYSYAVAMPYNDLQNRINIMSDVSSADCKEYIDKHHTFVGNKWTGPEDGLPPVGMECESHLSGSLWEIGCLTYIGNNLIVWKSHTGHEYATRPTDRVFRPLRTEEDKAVEDMLKVACGVTLDYEAICRALVAEGYRKLDTPNSAD